MRRIESKDVPTETRGMLRERFKRFLPTHSGPVANSLQAAHPLVSDMEVLDLFLHLKIVSGKDITRARRVYELAIQEQPTSPVASSRQMDDTETSNDAPSVAPGESAVADSAGTGRGDCGAEEDSSTVANNSDAASTPLRVVTQIISASPSLDGLTPPPSFDELVERGWIRISWNQFAVPDDIRFAVLRDSETVKTAFRRLIEDSYEDDIELEAGFNPSGDLRKIADGIVSGEGRRDKIVCVSREWIAARLWDTRRDELNDLGADDRISHWLDRWSLLDCPAFSMSNYLSRSSFEEFVSAALDVLNTPSTTPGWKEFESATTTPHALLYPQQGAAAESSTSGAPTTSVERVRWMMHGTPEQTFHEYLWTRGSSLLTVLLNELADVPVDPLRLAPRLMTLVVERPVMLQQLALRARRNPALLADMLMSPSTCAVACSIIANWDYYGSGWNREFQKPANYAAELFAFEDALAVLGGHLDEGNIDCDELAALYQYVFDLAFASHQETHRQAILSLLRTELAAADPSLQDSLVARLIALAKSSDNPTTAFCAALHLASDCGSVERIDPSELVTLYLDVVLPKGDSLWPGMLESDSAYSLVAMAIVCEDATRNRFWNAVDVPAWLERAPAENCSEYAHLEAIKRSLRLHIRILSRAIAGWPTEVPGELLNSLTSAVRDGAVDRPIRGRVDVFALGFRAVNRLLPEERSISLDLAAALRRVEGDAAQRLVSSLCQIEEPAVLAEIIADTPAAVSAQIKEHLRTLTPENSSNVMSLPALQVRVQALLRAELPDAAEIFMEAERGAMTLGNVPGREIQRLRDKLLLLLLREDWSEIDSLGLPENLDKAVAREAADTLRFYQAIAELKKAEGSSQVAESIFSDLMRRHPAVTTYRVNLFAARVARLLKRDVFQLLSGDSLRQAKAYLAEAQQEMRPLMQHSIVDTKTLDINRAILSLAINKPRETLEIALELREMYYEAEIEGFRALALARIGSRREALSLLMQTEKVFGRSDLLSAIRKNIDVHRPYMTAPQLALSDDPVPSIRHAFEVFSRLDHIKQAEVLQSHGELDLYLLEEVRGACGSLAAVASMMRALGVAREDDISGILKQILRSRLLLAQWSVEDQPRGGFSESGGVGERDIVVSKGAAELAVLEALIVDSIESRKLTKHFNKLLGYGTCCFFAYIAYARRANSVGILDFLKKECTAPPTGIKHIRSYDLEDHDSLPVGFRAQYEVNSRMVVVTFLVVELGQEIQRAAATA